MIHKIAQKTADIFCIQNVADKEKKEIYVIGQSERTCVVYGMPFALEKAGLSDEILDLEQIADVMFKRMR